MNANNANPRVLYCGDTSLGTAASYLAGVLTHCGIEFDYVDSSTPIKKALGSQRHELFILSDYPGSNLDAEDHAFIIEKVAAGAGLLMIGGWESFCGANGEYNASPLADILPVDIASSDDRINFDTPCVLEKACDHPITRALPFDRPPTIGGRNNISAKTGSEVLLNARSLDVTVDSSGKYNMSAGAAAEMLVISTHGKGRVTAYAGDVAPHWVGGLVDWGDKRVQAQAENAGDIEVGNWYAELFCRMVCWTAGTCCN